MVEVKEDLTGKTFGRLKVLKQVEDKVSKNGIRNAAWLCECSCEEHNLVIISGRELKRKGRGERSCGCWAREQLIKRNKKGHKNVYDLSGEYGIGYTPKGEEFWFDLEDYEKIKDYCWSYDDSGYVSTINRVKLHRLVMNAENPEIIIDHINHPPRKEHKVDNRKENLRIVTRSQNKMNSHVPTNNKSGEKGVTWNEKLSKWVVRIGVDNKRIYLGVFSDFEEAVKTRKEAENKYYKEYKCDN